MAWCNQPPFSGSVFFLFLVALIRCGDTQVQKITHLHFYFHETFSEPNPTVVRNVNPPRNDSSFGTMGVHDAVITEGPELTSKLLGRVEGLVVLSSTIEDLVFLTMFNIVFTDGPYKGSTLSLFGRAALGTVIERPIIGGTGQFRFARGYVVSVELPSPPEWVSLEYDAYIVGFDMATCAM